MHRTRSINCHCCAFVEPPLMSVYMVLYARRDHRALPRNHS
jgi:hypothetical protein